MYGNKLETFLGVILVTFMVEICQKMQKMVKNLEKVTRFGTFFGPKNFIFDSDHKFKNLLS